MLLAQSRSQLCNNKFDLSRREVCALSVAPGGKLPCLLGVSLLMEKVGHTGSWGGASHTRKTDRGDFGLSSISCLGVSVQPYGQSVSHSYPCNEAPVELRC